MPRKDQGWITFQTSEEERQLLEDVCQLSQRTKTEVLRELLRGLRYSTPVHSEEGEPAPVTSDHLSDSQVGRSVQSPSPLPSVPPSLETLPSRKSLKVSSRNILEGRIKRMIKGSVSTEVTLEIVHRVELTSTITTTSAETLELQEGKLAYAVIKSSDVVIAMD